MLLIILYSILQWWPYPERNDLWLPIIYQIPHHSHSCCSIYIVFRNRPIQATIRTMKVSRRWNFRKFENASRMQRIAVLIRKRANACRMQPADSFLPYFIILIGPWIMYGFFVLSRLSSVRKASRVPGSCGDAWRYIHPDFFQSDAGSPLGLIDMGGEYSFVITSSPGVCLSDRKMEERTELR
jgi:hypothetical protein